MSSMAAHGIDFTSWAWVIKEFKCLPSPHLHSLIFQQQLEQTSSTMVRAVVAITILFCFFCSAHFTNAQNASPQLASGNDFSAMLLTEPFVGNSSCLDTPSNVISVQVQIPPANTSIILEEFGYISIIRGASIGGAEASFDVAQVNALNDIVLEGNRFWVSWSQQTRIAMMSFQQVSRMFAGASAEALGLLFSPIVRPGFKYEFENEWSVTSLGAGSGSRYEIQLGRGVRGSRFPVLFSAASGFTPLGLEESLNELSRAGLSPYHLGESLRSGESVSACLDGGVRVVFCFGEDDGFGFCEPYFPQTAADLDTREASSFVTCLADEGDSFVDLVVRRGECPADDA